MFPLEIGLSGRNNIFRAFALINNKMYSPIVSLKSENF